MDASAYWLIVLDEDRLEVALVNRSSSDHRVIAAGPVLAWEPNNEDMLLAAVDQSLSAASQSAALSPDTEPQQASFVLPPLWIGADGKIIPHYSKLVELICKKFGLKPLGFISHDEAIVEEANIKDGFPSSFVLIHFDSLKVTISLAYLGKIKSRLQRSLSTPFNPSLIENTLLEIKTDAALPPQIIITGAANQSIYDALSAYPWVGKKNIETFLHYPDIKLIDTRQVLDIYTRVIKQELSPSPIPTKPLTTDSFYQTEVEDDSSESDASQPEELDSVVISQEEHTPLTDDLQSSIEEPTDSVLQAHSDEILNEVSPSELGFSVPEIDNKPLLEESEVSNSDSLKFPDNPTLPIIDAAQINLPESSELTDKPKTFPSFKLKLPAIGNRVRISPTPFWLFLALSPLLALIPFGFASARVTLYLNPYVFDKQVNVTLDPSLDNFSPASTAIPVNRNSLSVSVSTSGQATGKKTVGEKAKGEITIFNKQAKTQNLPAGTILTADGKKFELTTDVAVASSSSNLDEGVITLGQTRALVAALDIGPEYNLAKNQQLNFKDIAESSLVARVKEPFTGGSKRDINAVSESDRTALKAQAEKTLEGEIDQKIEKELPNTPGILRDTLKISENKIEFNREIGEEATEVTATLTADISVFSLKNDSTQNILSHFLASEEGFSDTVINPSDFNINFSINKAGENSATGTLTITGSALPKIDQNKIKKDISGKFNNKAVDILKKSIPRIYNYKIEHKLPYLGSFTPLPVSPNRIDLQIKANK